MPNNSFDGLLRDEMKKSLEPVSFDDNEKARIALSLNKRLDDAARDEPRSIHTETAQQPSQRRMRGTIAAGIAALTLAGGGVAVAVNGNLDLEALTSKVFPGSGVEPAVIEQIGQPIGKSVSSNGVTVMAKAMVGDRNSFAVLMDIVKDDGTGFDSLPSADKDGHFPIAFANSEFDLEGVMEGGGGRHFFYDEDPSEPSIQMVQQFSSLSEETIVGKKMGVFLEDLKPNSAIFGSNASDESIAEGFWSMFLDLNYKDSSVEVDMDQNLESGRRASTVTGVKVSPLSVSVDYVAHEGQPHDAGIGEVKLRLRSGGEIDASSEVVGCDEGPTSNECRTITLLTELVNVDSVEAVLVDDLEFKV